MTDSECYLLKERIENQSILHYDRVQIPVTKLLMYMYVKSNVASKDSLKNFKFIFQEYFYEFLLNGRVVGYEFRI